MGNCQNYGPFLGPYYNTGPNLGDPKRDHNFDNPPCILLPKGEATTPPPAAKRLLESPLGRAAEKGRELVV